MLHMFGKNEVLKNIQCHFNQIPQANSEEYAYALLPYALYAARFAVYEPSHIE